MGGMFVAIFVVYQDVFFSLFLMLNLKKILFQKYYFGVSIHRFHICLSAWGPWSYINLWLGIFYQFGGIFSLCLLKYFFCLISLFPLIWASYCMYIRSSHILYTSYRLLYVFYPLASLCFILDTLF